MFISRHNQRIEVSTIKYCKTLDGTRIYLFRNLSPSSSVNPYIVCARNGDTTYHFSHHISLRLAIDDYMYLILKYA